MFSWLLFTVRILVYFLFLFFLWEQYIGFFWASCVLLILGGSGAVFICFLILEVSTFTSSLATDLTIFSFFLSSPEWTNVAFIIIFFIVWPVRCSYTFILLFYLYLPLVCFFDFWYYSSTSVLFYQNTLLTNSLNLIHPVLVIGSTVYLLSFCVNLTSLFFLPQSFDFYLYLCFFHSRWLLYYVLMAGIALLFGCFWALQLGTWGGWWVWENSELFLLFLFFLLVTLLHSYFTVFGFFLVNALAIFCLVQYEMVWLFVFWWNPDSLHTFSLVSAFFFHHYFVGATCLLFFIIFTTGRTYFVSYFFICDFFPPTLLLGCWAGLWFSGASLLGGFFLIMLLYIFMDVRVFKSPAVLTGHLLFLIFLVLVIFFNFSSYAPVIVWLLNPYLAPLVYFIEAVVISFCSLFYLQTEPIYQSNLHYVPFTGLSFASRNLYSAFAYAEPIFVFLCASVICFYG